MKQGSLHRVAQSATDGAIARYYTQREWQEIANGLFEITSLFKSMGSRAMLCLFLTAV